MFARCLLLSSSRPKGTKVAYVIGRDSMVQGTGRADGLQAIFDFN